MGSELPRAATSRQRSGDHRGEQQQEDRDCLAHHRILGFFLTIVAGSGREEIEQFHHGTDGSVEMKILLDAR